MKRGGFWWFVVFAGALAEATAVRFAVNGGYASGSTSEKVYYSAVAIFGSAAIIIGLVQAIRKGREINIDTADDDDLRIT